MAYIKKGTKADKEEIRRRHEEKWLKARGFKLGERIRVINAAGVAITGILKRIDMQLGRMTIADEDDFPFSLNGDAEISHAPKYSRLTHWNAPKAKNGEKYFKPTPYNDSRSATEKEVAKMLFNEADIYDLRRDVNIK